MIPRTSDLAYHLLRDGHEQRPYSREEIMMDVAFPITFFAIPLLAIIVCFVVTWIWGD